MAGNWTKITVKGNIADLDGITAVMSMLDNGLMIEDYSDFSLNGMYGELVDEEILNADRSVVKVSLFVPEEKNLLEYKEYLDARLTTLGIKYEMLTEGMNEEDWSESWKQYYKPIPLGRVTIVPAWEKYDAQSIAVFPSILVSGSHFFNTLSSAEVSIGFGIKSLKPDFINVSRAPSTAFAVSATIGTFL